MRDLATEKKTTFTQEKMNPICNNRDDSRDPLSCYFSIKSGGACFLVKKIQFDPIWQLPIFDNVTSKDPIWPVCSFSYDRAIIINDSRVSVMIKPVINSKFPLPLPANFHEDRKSHKALYYMNIVTEKMNLCEIFYAIHFNANGWFSSKFSAASTLFARSNATMLSEWVSTGAKIFLSTLI